MVATQIAAANQRIEGLRTFREGLDSALMHLRDLPAKDGPCDPACEFLRDVPDRVPTLDLQPRSETAPVRQEPAEADGVAVACSLDAGQYDERATRWRRLLGSAPRERTATGGITVHLPADQAAAVAELVVEEQQCCPFFTFQLAFLGATVALTTDASVQAQPLVDALLGGHAGSVEKARTSC
jgi:hypothetical protein